MNCSNQINLKKGYYNCKICEQDYCPECAFDRDNCQLEMEENPAVFATPFQEVIRDTIVSKNLQISRIQGIETLS